MYHPKRWQTMPIIWAMRPLAQYTRYDGVQRSVSREETVAILAQKYNDFIPEKRKQCATTVWVLKTRQETFEGVYHPQNTIKRVTHMTNGAFCLMHPLQWHNIRLIASAEGASGKIWRFRCHDMQNLPKICHPKGHCRCPFWEGNFPYHEEIVANECLDFSMDCNDFE